MLLSFLISVVSLLVPSFALYLILFAASFLCLFPFFFFSVVICPVLLHSVFLFFCSFLPACLLACSHPSFLPFFFLFSVHLVLIFYLPFWYSSNSLLLYVFFFISKLLGIRFLACFFFPSCVSSVLTLSLSFPFCI